MRPKILPVIHYRDEQQCFENAAVAFAADCEGVFLIQMNGDNDVLIPAARKIKERWPERLVGTNFLGLHPAYAAAANIDSGLDMTWTDVQVTHSEGRNTVQAELTAEILSRKPEHLFFTGVAFKHQEVEPEPGVAALKAITMNMVPTTSGAATGVAAEVEKVAALRRAIRPQDPLAIASGITPENIASFAPHLSHILVSTGISSSFYKFAPHLLDELQGALSA